MEMMDLFFSRFSKWITLIGVISVLIFSISCFFLKKEPLREAKSKFESGIDQSEQETMPFYMHFFHVGVLFLLFDVEVVLSIPMIQSSMSKDMWVSFWIIFIIIIFLGLILEIMIDSVEWKE